jgi:uncharacterized protein
MNASLAIRLQAMLATALVSFAPTAHADLATGLAAYDGGDYAGALRELTPLAEEGNAAAQNVVGAMYGKGLGVRFDYRTAMDWYIKAAAQEHAAAQNNLGFMYLNGQGTEKDLVQAYAWFSFAAASGNEDARRNKPLAASKMSPEQIASGEQLVQGGSAPLATAARLAARDAPRCPLTTAVAHPDIKWQDDLSCLLDADGRTIDTSTVEVAVYMSRGYYEFVRECRVGEDVLRVFRDKGRNRPHLGSPPHEQFERYSYIVIRTSPKGTDHHFHEVSEKAHWARRIKACRTP